MRGALHVLPVIVEQDRIIPADAGSTRFNGEEIDSIGDHPRGCGEHNFVAHNQLYMVGSSPRMRGAQAVTRLGSMILRIIPADAGSTHPEILVAYRPGDHPRGCGEHVIVDDVAQTLDGSSPRMRGARKPR